MRGFRSRGSRSSRAGVAAAAAGRLVLHLGYPVSIVAVALALVALERLPRRACWMGGPALALRATILWPGAVPQSGLDAKPVNALGVVLAPA